MDKYLIIGKSGQLAQAFSTLPNTILAGRQEVELTSLDSIRKLLSKHHPTAVVNTAAYTAVDLAENDERAAYAVNETGAQNIAICCAELGLPLIHVSTDYVFDGTSTEPYQEDDKTNPLGVYGKSKLAGEHAVLSACPQASIVRTSWLYGGDSSNFVSTMLSLGSNRDQLSIVSDQFGRPTHVNDLRDGLLTMLSLKSTGVYHFSNTGDVISWYDFANEIFKNAALYGFKTPSTVTPIPSSDYPTTAQRPLRTVFNLSKFENSIANIPNWKTSLELHFSTHYKHS